MAPGVGMAGLGAQDAPNAAARRAKTKGEPDAPNEILRRVKTRVEPVYPDLARQMNITGTVRLAVVVAPNGTVKDVKVVGGHPVLAGAAMEAVKKWRFEPATQESSGNVEIKFAAQH
ncbi:MAG: energy transducer TonB [Candidatus Sulfotelmatobacter sp.]